MEFKDRIKSKYNVLSITEYIVNGTKIIVYLIKRKKKNIPSSPLDHTMRDILDMDPFKTIIM
jgi:hypothetical protein